MNWIKAALRGDRQGVTTAQGLFLALSWAEINNGLIKPRNADVHLWNQMVSVLQENDLQI